MAKDYPVHLHIDLLDEYQGRHIGTKLVESLLALAKEQKKNGVIHWCKQKTSGRDCLL